MMQRHTLASAVHSVLSAAAEQICGLVERTVTEYEDRDVSYKLQVETQRRILDELLKPRVTLHRAVLSETTASDSWNSTRTRRLSSALSVLGRDCDGRPGGRKDCHSSSSSSSCSSQGELHPEGLTSSAEQQLRASQHRPPGSPVDIPSLRASACKQYRGRGRPEKASSDSETDTSDSGSGSSKSKGPSLAAAPVVKAKESLLPHPSSLSPYHVTVQDSMESTPPDAMMDRREAGQMMKKKKKKKPCDRFGPILTKKHAKLDTSAGQTSDRSRHIAGNPKSTPSCHGRGQFYTERLRRTERRPPAGDIPSAPLTRSSERGSGRRQRPSGVAAPGDAADAGGSSSAVAKPATLAALAARGWRGMKLGGGRRRVRVRDHTVLHPSLLSLCHVTIQDIMERSMALAREAGWKRKKWYPPQPHNRSWATRAKARKHTTPDASDQASSDTAMDRELHQHLQHMFEEDDNEEDFLGFSASDEETSVQRDVEDGQPSDRGSPDGNLTPTTMVSDISETSSASRHSGIPAKDSNAEPGGSMDSQSASSPSTRGDLCAEGLTAGAGKQLPVESPTEGVVVRMTSTALSMDLALSVLAKDFSAEPGGSKDSLTSSARGELYSEATHRPPVEVMADAHPPPALIVDFSILEKYSIKPGGSEEDSQSSSSTPGALFSDGLTTHTAEQLPAKSAADTPSASFDSCGRASGGRDYYGLPGLPRNASPHSECLKLLGRRRKTPAAAVSVHSVAVPDILERSTEDLAREAAEVKKKVLDGQASDHLGRLTAPLVKRSRLAIEDKEGGGVAVDGSSSKMEYFGFEDLGKSDSDEERTQAKVTMEAATVLAALSTSMDVLQTHDSQDNQSRSNPDFLHLPVCKEVVSTERQPRSPILVQEEPAPPPQSRGQREEEEEEELAKRPEEAHCSTLTLPAATSEDYNDNSWTEPLSSTSSETQDGGAPQPTGEGKPLRLRCSESDSDEWEETRGGTSSTGRGETRAEAEDSGASSHGTEDGGSEWEETCREAPPAIQSLKSRGRRKLKGQRLSLSDSESRVTFTGKTTCTVCGKRFRHKHNLIKHKMIHTGEHMATMDTGNNNPFGCTVCDRVFGLRRALDLHMKSHTEINHFSCTFCDKSFRRKFALVGHMTTHMAKKGKRL